MHFAPTADQIALRDAVRDLLTDRCPPTAVRAAWDPASPGYDPALWAELGEMGVLGILAPPEAGGLGLGMVELVLALEEAGRVALPGPVVEHAAVAVPVLAGAGHRDLAEVAAGTLLATAGAGVVGWAQAADLLVLLDGPRPRLLTRAEASWTPRTCVDASVRSATVTGTGTEVAGDPAGALERGALGCAAMLLGLAQQMLAMTVTYVGQRKQFGVPVGSQQAVKHHLADARVAVEYARPAVYAAACAVDTADPLAGRDCSFAKVYAARAAEVTGRAALQCHGAIGYTFEHDLHLWLKRVWVLQAEWGTTAQHRERVAAAVLRPTGTPG